MKKGKIVGFTYDSKTDYALKPGELPDKYAEFDAPETIELISRGLEANGHKVVRIGNVFNLLKLGKAPEVDIVFNIAEGLEGRNRESQVPIILELMGVPFVGSDALSLGISLDKVLAKKIFIAGGILTPKFFTAESLKDLRDLKLKFPLFVKPQLEGSSKGLDEGALTRNQKQLEKRVNLIVHKYRQPALVEEFISGREFTVAIIGNDEPRVYDPVQVRIKKRLELGDLFYSFAHITDSDLEYVYPPQISKKLNESLRKAALSAYKAIGCRDFGRVDFRVNEKGEIFVLEVNPLPCLHIEDVFMIIAQYHKLKPSDIIRDILDAALERYGLSTN